MSFIKQGKTNVKYLFILAIVAIFFGGIMVGVFELMRCPYFFPSSQQSQSAKDQTAGWQTYGNPEFSFKYPEIFGANVWRPVFWPPTTTVVSINEDPLLKGCGDLQSNSPAIKEQKITINNLDFTLYTASGAGAGNLYSNYCYITVKDQKYYIVYFLINSHTGCYQGGCGAYCGTQYEQECRNFDLSRDVEKPIGTIMSTFNFLK